MGDSEQHCVDRIKRRAVRDPGGVARWPMSSRMLIDKVVVIYGAGGGIGSAVARAFGRQGADLYLAGRRLVPVEAVAEEIVSAGGSAQAAEVDALDEQALNAHLRSVVDKAGRVDGAFEAVRRTQ